MKNALLVVTLLVLGVGGLALVNSMRPMVDPFANGGTVFVLQIPTDEEAAGRLSSILTDRLTTAGIVSSIQIDGDRLSLDVAATDEASLARVRRLITQRGLLQLLLTASLAANPQLAAEADRVQARAPDLEAELAEAGVMPLGSRRLGERVAEVLTKDVLSVQFQKRWRYYYHHKDRAATSIREYVLVEPGIGVISSADLAGASSELGQFGPIPGFTLLPAARERFCQITTDHQSSGADPRRLAILLDERVVMVPSIETPICEGSAVISGDYSVEEVEDIVTMFSTGALPVSPKLVEERPLAR